MSEEKKNKNWKKDRIFNSYEEAANYKAKMLFEDDTSELLVKIRRCGDGGSRFKVVYWRPKK
jgi:hypothetical protein|tara:strand:+ start:682 stop:867 length:186 start_codon:yes stop_codon:yes gene_type:complete